MNGKRMFGETNRVKLVFTFVFVMIAVYTALLLTLSNGASLLSIKNVHSDLLKKIFDVGIAEDPVQVIFKLLNAWQLVPMSGLISVIILKTCQKKEG